MSKYASRICRTCLTPVTHKGLNNSNILKVNAQISRLNAIREMSIRGKSYS